MPAIGTCCRRWRTRNAENKAGDRGEPRSSPLTLIRPPGQKATRNANCSVRGWCSLPDARRSRNRLDRSSVL